MIFFNLDARLHLIGYYISNLHLKVKTHISNLHLNKTRIINTIKDYVIGYYIIYQIIYYDHFFPYIFMIYLIYFLLMVISSNSQEIHKYCKVLFIHIADHIMFHIHNWAPLTFIFYQFYFGTDFKQYQLNAHFWCHISINYEWLHLYISMNFTFR